MQVTQAGTCAFSHAYFVSTMKFNLIAQWQLEEWHQSKKDAHVSDSYMFDNHVGTPSGKLSLATSATPPSLHTPHKIWSDCSVHGPATWTQSPSLNTTMPPRSDRQEDPRDPQSTIPQM